jgi:hypothetical protein
LKVLLADHEEKVVFVDLKPLNEAIESLVQMGSLSVCSHNQGKFKSLESGGQSAVVDDLDVLLAVVPILHCNNELPDYYREDVMRKIKQIEFHI